MDDTKVVSALLDEIEHAAAELLEINPSLRTAIFTRIQALDGPEEPSQAA